MFQYMKYGVCMLIVLSVSQDAQANEVNELKIKNALFMAEEVIKTAADLLYFCDSQEIAHNLTTNTSRLENATFSEKFSLALEKIHEAQKLNPICENPNLYAEPVDCSEVLANGNTESGVYSIWPRSRVSNGKPVEVYCDMETDGGGWTVIQRRGNFSNQQNFYQDWEQYKNGFGDITADFWLGNDHIHALSNQASNEIRFDLQDTNGEQGFAQYKTFWIDNEDSSYTLHISDYTGNVGDTMKHHNNMKFSTKDRGSTQYARFYKGGWWYNNWAHSNLNGRYLLDKPRVESVHWWYWRQNKGLVGVEIKIRPR